MACAQGQVTSGKKNVKTTPFVTSPTKKTYPKLKIGFNRS